MALKFKTSLLLLLAVSPVGNKAIAGINIYLSAPKTQTIDAAITGSSIENFNSTTAGNFTSYTSTVAGNSYARTTGTSSFIANDQFGGYQLGNYLGVQATSSVTLTIGTARKYFGIYFTAADANNTIQIYNGTTLLSTFNTASLLNILPNNTTSTVTATNGTKYNTNQYYGQPTSGSNANEPYAYISFFATGTDTINRVVLTQAGGAIFENDNHSFVTAAPAVPGGYVLIPEPSTYALVGLGALGLIIARRKQALV